MKKRLNVFCVIVLLVLGYSVIEATYYVSIGMKAGFEKGFGNETSKEEREKMANLHVVQLLPDNFGEVVFLDSIYNEKSGEYIPASYSQMFVSVDAQPGLLSRAVSVILAMADFVAVIWAIVLFIRLIVAINRSAIFNWKNVRRLRRLGILLIISFACTLSMAFLSTYQIEKVFAAPGYSLIMGDMVQITSLVLGLSALIVAEVFAIGLKMKEEHDLTI